jgi:hypothetical protein
MLHRNIDGAGNDHHPLAIPDAADNLRGSGSRGKSDGVSVFYKVGSGHRNTPLFLGMAADLLLK